jgi:hypothetical protein
MRIRIVSMLIVVVLSLFVNAGVEHAPFCEQGQPQISESTLEDVVSVPLRLNTPSSSYCLAVTDICVSNSANINCLIIDLYMSNDCFVWLGIKEPVVFSKYKNKFKSRPDVLCGFALWRLKLSCRSVG